MIGDVAGDAQAEAAVLAIRVLREAEIDAHVKASDCGPVRFALYEGKPGEGKSTTLAERRASYLGSGVESTPVSAERVADRASSGAPGDTSDASREFASSRPSKPVCSVCEVCGGESAFDLTFCAHCGDALDVRAQEGGK